MKKIVLFASGSGSNVENIANYISKYKQITISKVYCNNPDAYVIKRCENLGFECVIFDRNMFSKSDIVLDLLLADNPDLIVLAGFLWLVPLPIITAFRDKIVNIHPALLPNYGGKGMYGDKVHKAVVENREEESGITIHFVNEKFDDGKVIFQAKCKVESGDEFQDVAAKVHALEYKHFPEVIVSLLNKE